MRQSQIHLGLRHRQNPIRTLRFYIRLQPKLRCTVKQDQMHLGVRHRQKAILMSSRDQKLRKDKRMNLVLLVQMASLSRSEAA